MKTMLAVFSNKEDADLAIADLEQRGLDPKDMSIIVKDEGYRSQRRGAKGGAAMAGMGSGAVAGGVIGGLTGLLIGLGTIAIPGIGAFLIGGPIAAALGLTGAAAATVSGATTGVLAGGLVGGLVGLGVPEETARVYEQRVRDGGVLLAVPILQEKEYDEVREILENYDADQIRTISETRLYA